MYHCPQFVYLKRGFFHACNNSTYYWMRIYFDHQLCLLFSNIYWNLTVKQGTTLCTVKLFIQLIYDKSDHLAKWSIFVRYLMSSFAYTTPFPPLDPRRHLHMFYICTTTFNCPKGILGLGGGGGKHLKTNWKTPVSSFNDKRHNFKYISYACSEGLPQSFGNEGHLYP